ncbi:MAG: acetolactate synthase large subunit [Pseudomonadota bacterium]
MSAQPDSTNITGADALIATLLHNDVDTCFTNPGTSEMHFVAALDREPQMRCVLGLFEGGVTGAADGYARMAGKPACTLLHLGPGLANGLANLHNARRAHSPMVNVVGEHATYHRRLDAPLTADIEGFARPVSGWIRTCSSAEHLASDGAAAVAAARQGAGQISTLILPADLAWSERSAQAPESAPAHQLRPHRADLTAIAGALSSGEPVALLVNGRAVIGEGLELLGRLAQATGATAIGDTFISRVERGAGRPAIRRLPYFAEQAIETLSAYRHLVLIDTQAPVSFFAYPGVPSELTPAGCTVHRLTEPGDDTPAALRELLAVLGVPEVGDRGAISAHRPDLVRGPLNPAAIAAAVGHYLPEHAIVVNEAATGGFGMPGATIASPPHDWLDLTGGAIGMGIPAATGAAIACPDRRVINLQADGSAMYTLQALWTQAREQLDVTTIIFANRAYAILQVEFARVGAHNPGRRAMDMMSLDRPELDFVALATGMGVAAERVTTAEDMNAALARCLETPGPNLIEAII